MISGQRDLIDGPLAVRTASPWLAVVLLATSAGIVAMLVNL